MSDNIVDMCDQWRSKELGNLTPNELLCHLNIKLYVLVFGFETKNYGCLSY
jgi:hypothetical protein